VPEETHNNYKKNLKLIDQLIGDKPYLTGNGLTLADLTLLATTANIEWYEDFDFNEYPNYRDWSFRLKSALPYYDEINGITKEDRDAKNLKLKIRFESLKKQ